MSEIPGGFERPFRIDDLGYVLDGGDKVCGRIDTDGSVVAWGASDAWRGSPREQHKFVAWSLWLYAQTAGLTESWRILEALNTPD